MALNILYSLAALHGMSSTYSQLSMALNILYSLAALHGMSSTHSQTFLGSSRNPSACRLVSTMVALL